VGIEKTVLGKKKQSNLIAAGRAGCKDFEEKGGGKFGEATTTIRNRKEKTKMKKMGVP